jgi:polysaccharide biosynthesis protein PslG
MSTGVRNREHGIARPLRVAWLAAAAGFLAFAIVYALSPSAPRLVHVGTLQAGTNPIMSDGMNIPWAVGGLRIERDGTKNDFPGTWPTTPVSSQRLWDTRTSWADLEPAQGQLNFARLDQFVTKAQDNGLHDVLMVLSGTPRWAASQVLSTDAAWIGPGSASMPVDLGAWRQFVSAVATRYKGRITAYEIGNEPNLKTFWNGTPDQWRQYVTAAAEVIRQVDPSATIAVNVGVVSRSKDVGRLTTWLKPIKSLASNHQVDAVTVHFYPYPGDVKNSTTILKKIIDTLKKEHWASVPRWITEINVRNGSGLRASEQVSDVPTLVRNAQKAGFDRLYWYAWTSLGPEDLIQFYAGEPGEQALQQLG